MSLSPQAIPVAVAPMMDWTDESGLAVQDQSLVISVCRQVAPMSHLIFQLFCLEMGGAMIARCLPPAVFNLAEMHQI
jgi:hypothetical protein